MTVVTEQSPDTFEYLLRPTYFLDHDAPEIQEFVDRWVTDRDAPAAKKAVELYYAVRDHVFYEVYDADLSHEGLRASSIAVGGQGFCLHKSILYAAAVRAVGIPSRLVYGDVRNHLASDRLKQHIGGDVFFHGLTSVFLDGRWMKATPVFNKLLCRLYGMTPLEFDGTGDSLYHPFDGDEGDSSQAMQFLRMHGEFDDLPYDYVMTNMRAKHPKFVHGDGTVAGGSLAAEAS
ncbi:transglutaminase-like domain-containing protein [Streptomyces agglomeratus]|uniref:transglutaminase-like domain-containing protein n=1 Tax=Streptomyces agglomeratus TaxID=285458 RepID=UPI000854EA55|nr:transglutaminase-like domain-containing protein [Streptomyces agglomeratus]OEJ53102.1 transglutaminase-like superfamily protein [Streptomyces agglomeratus]